MAPDSASAAHNLYASTLRNSAFSCRVSKGGIVLSSQKKDFKAVLSLFDEDLLPFEPIKERWVVNSKRRPYDDRPGPLARSLYQSTRSAPIDRKQAAAADP